MHLLLVQGSGILAALIATPYLVAKVGLDGYGRYAWTIGIVGLLSILADFGMGLHGTQAISARRDDADWVGVRSLIIARGACAAIATAILLLVALAIPINDLNRNLLLAAIPALIAAGVSPLWLYQGMQDMGFIAYATSAGRIVWLGTVFILVDSRDDVILVMLLDGLIALAISGASLARCRGPWINPGPNDWRSIPRALRGGLPFLVSNASSYFYTAFAVVVVGLVSHPTQTAAIAIADRVSTAAKRMVGIPLQAVMPAVQRNRLEFPGWRARESRAITMTWIFGSIAGLSGAALLVAFWTTLFPGVPSSAQVPAVLLLIAIPFVAASYAAGITTLSGLGRSRSVALLQGAIAVAIQGPMFAAATHFGATGAAAAVLACEAALAVVLTVQARRLLEDADQTVGR